MQYKRREYQYGVLAKLGVSVYNHKNISFRNFDPCPLQKGSFLNPIPLIRRNCLLGKAIKQNNHPLNNTEKTVFL